MALFDIAGETTLTGKNQVSLPARGVRQLGWTRGDRLIVQVVDQDTMVLRRRPENPAEYYAGRLSGVFGTHEETIRFLEEERASWEPGADEPVMPVHGALPITRMPQQAPEAHGKA